MKLKLSRQDFQTLADERALDAAALVQAGRWSAAYYLAGYAVECALKACIAKRTVLDQFPDKDFARDCYTHRIEELVALADLKTLRDDHRKTNLLFGLNWTLAKDWDETARYQQWSETQARSLVSAITETPDGVLPWIKGHW